MVEETDIENLDVDIIDEQELEEIEVQEGAVDEPIVEEKQEDNIITIKEVKDILKKYICNPSGLKDGWHIDC